MLWSGIDIYHGKRWLRYKQLPFPETVYKLLNAYTKVDGIIGMRYHSFIFSELRNIPLLAVVDGQKAKGYFIDKHPENTVDVSGSASEDEIKEKVRLFVSILKKRGAA